MSPASLISQPDATRSILSAADELFYRSGISAVTMSDVRDLSGVSMRRLYSLYPSKSDLVAGWLSHRHDTWMAWFTRTVERHVAAGTDPVLAIFDAIGEWIASPDYRGCGFINSIAETSELDDRHRAIIADHKHSVLEHINVLARREHPTAPNWLPIALAVVLDGVLVQCAIFAGTESLTAARQAAEHLMETISS
jgi:AcrR family transcriptional regulator